MSAVQIALEEGYMVGDVIPTSKVMEAYNERLPEKVQLTERQVGVRLKNLGFPAGRARDEAGVQFRGRVINDEQLAALKKKFGLDDDDGNPEGLDTSQTSHTSQLDTAQACDDCESSGPSGAEDLRRVSQHVTPHASSYATPSESTVTTVTSDVQTRATQIANHPCNCLDPEHFAEGEPHPPSCPDCGNTLHCRACGGCIGCKLP